MKLMQSVQRSSRVAIETLESRTFLSATPVGHHAVLHPTPAVKARPALPGLANATYSADVEPAGVALILIFTSESKAGALHGAALIGTTSASTNAEYIVTGTVTRSRKLTLHGKSKKLGITLTGTLSADLTTFTGKLATTGAKKNLHSSFTATGYINAP